MVLLVSFRVCMLTDSQDSSIVMMGQSCDADVLNHFIRLVRIGWQAGWALVHQAGHG